MGDFHGKCFIQPHQRMLKAIGGNSVRGEIVRIMVHEEEIVGANRGCDHHEAYAHNDKHAAFAYFAGYFGHTTLFNANVQFPVQNQYLIDKTTVALNQGMHTQTKCFTERNAICFTVSRTLPQATCEARDTSLAGIDVIQAGSIFQESHLGKVRQPGRSRHVFAERSTRTD